MATLYEIMTSNHAMFLLFSIEIFTVLIFYEVKAAG